MKKEIIQKSNEVRVYVNSDTTKLDAPVAEYVDARGSAIPKSERFSKIPVIPNIDAVILAKIESKDCSLNMHTYHACATIHCRAGWAIHLAGDEGYALEKENGSFLAGMLIYEASRPGVKAPNFFATNEVALADLRKCAAESQ